MVFIPDKCGDNGDGDDRVHSNNSSGSRSGDGDRGLGFCIDSGWCGDGGEGGGSGDSALDWDGGDGGVGNGEGGHFVGSGGVIGDCGGKGGEAVASEEGSGKVWGVESRSDSGGGDGKVGGVTSDTLGGEGVFNGGVGEDKVSNVYMNIYECMNRWIKWIYDYIMDWSNKISVSILFMQCLLSRKFFMFSMLDL